MEFAFISRHAPSEQQIEMARLNGIELTHVGDADAFNITPGDVDELGAFEGVVVVHPAAAMRLARYFLVGVFEIEPVDRSVPVVPGQPPRFKNFWVYDLTE